MRAGATDENREDVINGLRNFIPDSTVLVFDTTQLLSATDVAVNMLVLFFNIGAHSLLATLTVLVRRRTDTRTTSSQHHLVLD